MAFKNNYLKPPCEKGYFERLNYYFGKLMTVRDFEAEQSYLNEKRWLLNNRTIGWGVVCGLEVTKESDNRVKVNPGFALDRYGYEIMVCQPQYVEIKTTEQENPYRDFSEDIERSFFICIKFKICKSEPSPVPIEECGGFHTECEYNRIRETFELKLVEIETSYSLIQTTLDRLKERKIPEKILNNLNKLKGKEYKTKNQFLNELGTTLNKDQFSQYNSLIFSQLETKHESELDLCDSPFEHAQETELDCIAFLENPCPTIIQSCEERNQCDCLRLAKVTTIEDDLGQWKIIDIDNCTYRKLLLSNDMLFQAGKCLTEQLWKVHTARIDRRQFVPLLAQTIKGLKYKDGRILTINQVGEIPIGSHPFSITTDGDFLWFTDQEENFIRKLSRNGREIERFELPFPGWGIAFDGDYIWVTHITPDQDSAQISRIKASDSTIEPIVEITEVNSDAREIVFDNKYMWVSHLNNKLTRIDIITPNDSSKQHTFDELANEIGAEVPITDLAFDGESLWVGYDADNGLRKITIQVDSITVSDQIVIANGNPNGICFDGTHIWVGHEYGASKVDINNLQQIDIADAQKFLTRVAFDGMYAWALQPNENRANRIEIFDVDVHGGVQTRELNPQENHNILRVCFDGIFIWVTAYIESESVKEGIIYRLLL